MTVIGTQISWADSTWNFAVGCTKVSDGCTNCYAAFLVDRKSPRTFGHPFSEVRLHLNRLDHVRKFKPIIDSDGKKQPHLVFCNSMSDWAHEAIEDQVVHQVLDVMEAHPDVVFQLLTKRPVRAKQVLGARYGGRGLPRHIWIGVSTEDNRVAARLNVIRRLQDQVGAGTFFVSVEPIIGPTDALDFTGIAWAIFGGESGPSARVMQEDWLLAGLANASKAGSAIWFKQWGQLRSNPLLKLAPRNLGITKQFAWLVEHGLELFPGEKGGATLGGRQTYRELPPAFHAMKADMDQPTTLL